MKALTLIASVLFASTAFAEDNSISFEGLTNSPPSKAFDTTTTYTPSWITARPNSALSESLYARAQRDSAIAGLARAEERSLIMQQNHEYGIYRSPRSIELSQVIRDAFWSGQNSRK